LKYALAALVLFGATGVALSLGRLWRHRAAHGFDAGAVSERWLSDIRRGDD
jgi:hypothetical protein